MKYLTLDIGGTFIKYAIMDDKANILGKGKIPTPMEGLEDLIETIGELADAVKGEIEGIAISMPGFIDVKNGIAITGGSLQYVQNCPFKALIAERCKIPASIANDARSAAMAELWKGNLQDCSDAVVLVCGTGVGGAVVVDRKVLQGKHFFAGEFSFIISNTEESKNSERLFGFRNGAIGLSDMAIEMLGVEEEKLSGEEIFSLALSGNMKAQSAIKLFAQHLAVQMVNMQCVVDPERIAVGGGISAQPYLFECIEEALEDLMAFYEDLKIPMPKPQVVPCRFFNDSNLIGALYNHLNNN